MTSKLLLLITVILASASSVYAQSFKTYETNQSRYSKNVSIEAELSLDYRSDQLREQQNNNTTNIRNLSLLGNLFEDDRSKFVFEILGEENGQGDLNLNVGELYYKSKFSFLGLEDSAVQVGIMKLNYGILNNIDGMFVLLPSYYSYLYDLPRGLDTGVSFSTALFSKDIILSANVFAGKNLRPADRKNREVDVIPYHLKLTWTPNDKSVFGLNYFSRKYDGQPLVNGFGAEMAHLNLLQVGGVILDLQAEIWNIQTSLNSSSMSAVAGLIAPKLSFKKVFFQPYLSLERWTGGNAQAATEFYMTSKLGYSFNKNIQFMVEQTQIQNLNTKLYKENSIQARVVSQWVF